MILEATYQARAIPVGSARFWSWRFAAPEIRAPLLGIYALLAEWAALTDPATERAAAELKLAWWMQEVQRLAQRQGVHPISLYLQSLPRAATTDFGALSAAVQAAALQVGGAPLESAADLPPHTQAALADPLQIVSRLAGADIAQTALRECTQALAIAEYLSRYLTLYRQEMRVGRVPFAVDELLAAGIENSDLIEAQAPASLAAYLAVQQRRAAQEYSDAAAALTGPSVTARQRASHRHLLVLAALGQSRLRRISAAANRRPLRDMLLAWRTARRANS